MSEDTKFPSASKMFPDVNSSDLECLREEVRRGIRGFLGGYRSSDKLCEFRVSHDYSPDEIAAVAHELKEEGYYVRSFRGYDATGIHEIGISPGWYRGFQLRKDPFAPLSLFQGLGDDFALIFTTYVEY